MSAQPLRVLVLGSAAGGGSPQWNCRCRVCQRVRAGGAGIAARTQTSIAVSADGARWLLINASPDLREQMLATPRLWPARGTRHSPVEAVLLTGAEVDQVAGLLTLRERHPLRLYASRATLEALEEASIFRALDPDLVSRHGVELDAVLEPRAPDGTSMGLAMRTFAVPGKVPLYQEEEGLSLELDAVDERNVGIEVRAKGDSSRSLFFIPGCAAWTPALREALDGAAVVMFDGTLARDDELVREGLGSKTGRRMGHMSVFGDRGSIAAFEGLDVERKIFVHVNNSNPVLLPDTPERRAIEQAGWEIAHDGMEMTV